jgi:2-(1,2-epoxy-1,2-dihydrophenyl)acetyl-CoA isomerase
VSDDFRVWTRGPARWLAPDRPGKLNAWTYAMAARLTGEFAAAAADPAVKVIVLAGTGGVFSAGIDRGVIAGEIRPTPFDVECLVKSRTPTIACVDGLAFGMGATSALACDLCVASTRASFTFGFVKVGLTPEWGSSYLLSRKIGLSRAMDLCLTARTVDADEAYRLGLVDRLVEAEQVEDTTQALAKQIAEHETGTVQRSKALLWSSLEAGSFNESREIELQAAIDSRHALKAAEASLKADDVMGTAS